VETRFFIYFRSEGLVGIGSEAGKSALDELLMEGRISVQLDTLILLILQVFYLLKICLLLFSYL
jgi:hypothetical protein